MAEGHRNLTNASNGGGSDAPGQRGGAQSPAVSSLRREVAFHEAAHAVIGRRLGFGLVEASVIADQQSHGRCAWNPALSGLGGALVYLAGPAATDEWATELGGDPFYRATELVPDTIGAMNIVAEVAGCDDEASEALYRLLMQLTRSTLTTVVVGKEVKDVAEALLARGVLSGDEIDVLLAERT